MTTFKEATIKYGVEVPEDIEAQTHGYSGTKYVEIPIKGMFEIEEEIDLTDSKLKELVLNYFSNLKFPQQRTTGDVFIKFTAKQDNEKEVNKFLQRNNAIDKYDVLQLVHRTCETKNKEMDYGFYGGGYDVTECTIDRKYNVYFYYIKDNHQIGGQKSKTLKKNKMTYEKTDTTYTCKDGKKRIIYTCGKKWYVKMKNPETGKFDYISVRKKIV